MPATGNAIINGVPNASYAFDSQGNVVGQVSPSGTYNLNAPTFVPATADYAGIIAAYNAAVAAGGGIVQLLPVTYNIAGNSLPLANNVKYVGKGWNLSYTTIPDGSGATLLGGTIIQGNGTAPIFSFLPNDLIAYTGAGDGNGGWTSNAQYSSASLTSSGISNIGIRNGTYGIKAGAYRQAGILYSDFSNLWIEDCTSWGLWVENMLHCKFNEIYTMRCTGGQTYANSGTGAFMFIGGNSEFQSCYNAIPNSATNMISRAIRFISRGASGFNSLNSTYIQSSRFNQSTSTQATTCNTTANITVIDGTKFALEMPVAFSATAYGFTANQIYFVVSVVGNVIQVANTIGGTALTASGSGVSLGNVITQGFPCLEIVGYDTSQVNFDKIGGLDLEAGGTAKIVVQSGTGTLHGNMLQADASSTQALCTRNSSIAYENTTQVIKVDSDSSSGVTVRGACNNPSTVRNAPLGFYNNNGSFCANYGTTGGGIDFISANSGWGTVVQQNTNTAVSQQPYTFTNAAASPLSLGAFAQAITFTGTANGGVTLRSITAAAVGVVFEIANPTAFTLTITPTGAQTFNNNGSGTPNIVMAARSTCKLRADNLNGTFFWAVLATVGTVTIT